MQARNRNLSQRRRVMEGRLGAFRLNCSVLWLLNEMKLIRNTKIKDSTTKLCGVSVVDGTRRRVWTTARLQLLSRLSLPANH
jgi:hypothetical protein